jgi:hypothetical protein
MVADTALRGSEQVVVAAAVGREVAQRAVVHPHRQTGDQRGARVSEHVEQLGRCGPLPAEAIELGERSLEDVGHSGGLAGRACRVHAHRRRSPRRSWTIRRGSMPIRHIEPSQECQWLLPEVGSLV